MSNAPSAQQIQSFIQTYAPVLYLHPQEHYLPTSVEWFLEKAGNPLGDGKDAYYKKLSPNERKGDFSQARSYVHVKDPVGDHVEIQFWIFYAYNGPGTAQFPVIEYDLNLSPFGEHGGDWEHFTFRVDLATMKPTKVYLAQHGDGKLHNYGDLEQEKGRPVLYASKNGHATYSDIGDHATNVVLLNSTAKGSAFDTLTHSLLDVSPPRWLDFNGRWGPKITYSGAELDAKISKVHDRLSWFMKNLVPESAIKLAVTESGENKENGPTGPKQKSEWSSPETD